MGKIYSDKGDLKAGDKVRLTGEGSEGDSEDIEESSIELSPRLVGVLQQVYADLENDVENENLRLRLGTLHALNEDPK